MKVKVYHINNKKRVLILDVLRGTLIILMCLHHFMFFIYRYAYCGEFKVKFDSAIYNLGLISYKILYELPIVRILIVIVHALFFLMSGITNTISKNNFKKGGKILIFFILYYIIAVICKNFIPYTIILDFGIFFAYGIYIILFHLISKISLKWKIIITGLLFLVMIFLYIKEIDICICPLTWFGISQKLHLAYLDYYSIFPSIFFFSLGTNIGCFVQKRKYEEKTITNVKNISFLLWFSRNSFKIYIIHLIVYPIIFILFSLLINGGLI